MMTNQANTAARKALTGQVIEVLNNHEVVINKGSADGVNMDDRFLLYKEGGEMIDPESKENLGRLELVCGEGMPKHIQERITTLKSSKVRTIRKLYNRANTVNERFYISEDRVPVEEKVPVPFDNVEPGCLFKQIR